jgi:hypothetical protein
MRSAASCLCAFSLRKPFQVPRDQIPYWRAMEHLRGRLDHVALGSFDPDADLAPIVALIQQGCDLEADVLPIVAREMPELGRVGRLLRNWGAPWLVRALSTVRLPWLSMVRGDSPRTSHNPPYR